MHVEAIHAVFVSRIFEPRQAYIDELRQTEANVLCPRRPGHAKVATTVDIADEETFTTSQAFIGDAQHFFKNHHDKQGAEDSTICMFCEEARAKDGVEVLYGRHSGDDRKYEQQSLERYECREIHHEEKEAKSNKLPRLPQLYGAEGHKDDGKRNCRSDDAGEARREVFA